MNRPVRLLLSLAASSCGLIPFESSAPASAATTMKEAPALVRPVAHAPRRLIERSPLVEPTTEPLEFSFALVDAVFGN